MKFYLLNPQGCPPNPHLFPVWIPTWEEKGIEIVDRIEDCDVVLFDFHSRMFDYKQSDLDYIIDNRVRFVTFDEWDRGGMSLDIWPMPLTKQQEDFCYKFESTGQPRVHFCRLLDKTKSYPINVYPYEKAIFHEEPLLSPQELFSRPLDICYIVNHSPSRQRIADAIREDGRLKCNFRIGMQKIPFNDFLNEHRRAKLFISSGAGGYTDERKQLLFSIAGLIQEETDQLLLHPFTNEENCIKISSNPTQEELDLIFAIVNDKERLYRIYKSGYDFMKTYYSKEYIASYILEKIKEHLG